MKKPENQATESDPSTDLPAISTQPAHSSMDFALTCFQNGQWRESYNAWLHVLDAEPNHPEALLHLGLIALSSGLHQDAKVFFDHAIEFSADDTKMKTCIGQHCMNAGHWAYTEHYLTAVIDAKPTLITAFVQLADALWRQGRHAEALQLLISAMNKNSAATAEILPIILDLARQLGDLELESSLYFRATQYPDTHARGIELLAWCDDATVSEYHAQISQFADTHGRASVQTLPAERRQRLRVGFVIGNLAADDIRCRVEPLIRKLDSARFETIIFAKDTFQGENAQRLYLIADHWKATAHLDSDATDHLIREMSTDILVNVEAYSCLPALEPFVRRSAPLQLNWTNPPVATGLCNMDFIITGPQTDSEPTEPSPFQTEQYLRMPLTHAAYEFQQINCIKFPAKSRQRPFIFGCLIPINKISQKTWIAWSKILIANPATHLLLNSAALGESAKRHVIDKMLGYNINHDRILWVAIKGGMCSSEFWPMIDLGLCPLTGDSTSSTLLGISLDIPSIACGNTTPWGHAPGRMLQQLELDHYLAQSTQDYIDLATQIAKTGRDKKSVRDSLKESPLSDTNGYASAFGLVLKDLWRQQGGTLEQFP